MQDVQSTFPFLYFHHLIGIVIEMSSLHAVVGVNYTWSIFEMFVLIYIFFQHFLFMIFLSIRDLETGEHKTNSFILIYLLKRCPQAMTLKTDFIMVC